MLLYKYPYKHDVQFVDEMEHYLHGYEHDWQIFESTGAYVVLGHEAKHWES